MFGFRIIGTEEGVAAANWQEDRKKNSRGDQGVSRSEDNFGKQLRLNKKSVYQKFSFVLHFQQFVSRVPISRILKWDVSRSYRKGWRGEESIEKVRGETVAVM